MKWSEVRRRPVIGLDGARHLGQVDDLYIDAQRGQVIGLRARERGIVPRHTAVLLTRIKAIGSDAVTVATAGDLNKQSSFAEFETAKSATEIVGSKAVSEDGQEIGSVSDFEFDPDGGGITAYILGGGVIGWIRGEADVIPVSLVRSVGDGLIVVNRDRG